MNWQDIKEYPDYEINDNFEIRHKKNKKIKSVFIGSTGYKTLSLNLNKKPKPVKLHRILAKLFIENKDNKPFVNHINGNKLDNSLINLEWCTHKENMSHAFKTGLTNNTGVKNGMAIINDDIAMEIKKMLLKGISQQKIANNFKVSRSLILAINVGRLWRHVVLAEKQSTLFDPIQ